MRIPSLFVLVVILASCTAGITMKPVRYDDLLCDGNSKVWLIDQMIVEKSDISMHNAWRKELLIFFDNGHVQYLPVQELGHKKGDVGDYVLNSDERILSLYFKKAFWEFSLKEIAEDSIYLVPTSNSEAQFSLQLIPLPEMFTELSP